MVINICFYIILFNKTEKICILKKMFFNFVAVTINKLFVCTILTVKTQHSFSIGFKIFIS